MGKNKSKNKKDIKPVFLTKENLIRDISITALAVILLFLFFTKYSNLFKEKEQPVFEKKEAEKQLENPAINTEGWQLYANKWYGFEIKYPSGWPKPTLKTGLKSNNWEYRYEFRKENMDESNPYLGFDVAIYNVGKIKELFNTEEFPSYKFKMNENEICNFITGHMDSNEEYPAEEVYIPPNDDCRNAAFFFSLTRDEYIYNLTAIKKEGIEDPANPKKYAIDNFPEFFSVASSLNLIDIKREKAVPMSKRINAPMPVAAVKKDGNGQLVCAKKNDKPGKSKKGKGKHLDMECCLDSDEYPNPHCYYPPEKYGKYLK